MADIINNVVLPMEHILLLLVTLVPDKMAAVLLLQELPLVPLLLPLLLLQLLPQVLPLPQPQLLPLPLPHSPLPHQTAVMAVVVAMAVPLIKGMSQAVAVPAGL